jgi:tripartite-type tricarboxylate transporter receptor subunit TctC
VLVPLVLVVPASLEVDNLQDFIALLKKDPGKYSYGSAGNGTSSHIALYHFNKITGIDALHIPYRGTSPVITDLLAGRLDFAIDAPSVLAPYIQSGKLKALGVALPERLTSLPQVPTMAEAGLPDYEAYSWNAVWAPAGTPDDVLDKLHAALDRAVHDPALEARLNEMGALPFKSMSRQETAAYMQEQFDKWVPLVKESGATVE